MGLFGSILGGALNVGASIFGGISASNAAKAAKRNVEKQMRENQDWYNRRYNEDSTQRADAQRLLTLTQENIRRRNKEAAGMQAVMGGTDESVAAAKAANNEALADAVGRIAVAGDARKDNIEQQYLSTKADLNKQLNDIEMNRAHAISQAAQGAAKTGSGIADLFGTLNANKGK